MKKDYETMLRDLFDTYYQQCPNHRILYALYDEKKDQAHIVLDDRIEIIAFNNYQGTYAIKFALSIDCEEHFFNNYKDASTYEI
jgi:hypothetical protein